MPIDSGGNITRPPSPIPVSGQTADAPQVNVPIDDIYASMNQLVFLDGRKALRGNIPMNGHRAVGAGDAVAAQDYVTLAQLQAMIMGLGVPTGVIEAYTISSSVPPAGWVFANGQSLSRATFPVLWAAAQAGNNLAATQEAKTAGQYGPGNGSTTFTLPNLYADGGYFIRPITSGRGIGTIQQDELKEHTHAGTAASAGAHTHTLGLGVSQADGLGGGRLTGTGATQFTTSTNGAHTHELTITATGGSETRPKNIAYPVIIKA